MIHLPSLNGDARVAEADDTTGLSGKAVARKTGTP